MKVLIVGGGGREHALAWKCAQSERVSHVLVAPGNAGTALEDGCENVDIAADDIDGLVRFATEQAVGLTVVGPEQPLVAGITDAFWKAGLKIFGPGRAGAQLEGSKSHCKAFLARHAIPTAEYRSFDDLEEACAYIRRVGAPIVVKADGLAAGKGVTVASNVEEAVGAARDCLERNRFGEAGGRIVVEEFIAGEEVSFMCMVGGGHIVPLATSQDHKARDDGDLGPNTGGMGAYSPAACADEALIERIMAEIVEPTVAGLQRDGIIYTGFLYAGLMIDAEGAPRVLEYNCRMGDPETQPMLMRMRSDLVTHCENAIAGRLASDEVEWDPHVAIGVVMAASGYPHEYQTGQVIEGLRIGESDEDDAARPNTKVFHAGTRHDHGRIVTSGGRVLSVCARAPSIDEARRLAYARAATLRWEGCFYREDIGHRALARQV